jgi:protein arginine N-methyltransferase 1
MYEKVFGHGLMLTDQIRMATYQEAIHQVVQEGDVVADIGTGSGILAFFAVQAGASKVYAVEQGEIIEDAERLAQANRLQDKVVFLRGRSDRIELPEKVDVIVSEIIGSLGLEEHLPRFQIDFRDRFLKPGGRLVPSWLEVCVIPVEAGAIWEKYIGLWDRNYYGLDFSPVRSYAVSQRYVTDCSGQVDRLAAPCVVSHSDLSEVERVPLVFQGQSAISRGGTFHGLVGYFRAGLAPGVVLSTSPEEPPTHWRQTFLPMEEPVAVKDSDEVCYEIKAIPLLDTVSWQWDTSVYRSGAQVAGFSQCNLHLSREELVTGRAGFRPILTQEGEVRRRVLDLCDGERSMKEIAELLFVEYPERYRGVEEAWQGALDIVRPLVRIE